MAQGTSLPWIWWSVGAVITFILVAAAVFALEQHPALLLGWAVGMILGAVLMLFRKSGR